MLLIHKECSRYSAFNCPGLEKSGLNRELKLKWFTKCFTSSAVS